MRIFISSTFIDLRLERQAVAEALHSVDFIASGMEWFCAEPSTPLEVALRELSPQTPLCFWSASKRVHSYLTILAVHTPKQNLTVRWRSTCPFLHSFEQKGGQWQNQEADEFRKAALNTFKNKVLSTVTPDYFESVSKLREQVLLALGKWNDRGRAGARLTFASVEEFFAPYRGHAGKLFDFDQKLRGRTEQVEELNKVLSTPGILVGAAIRTGKD